MSENAESEPTRPDAPAEVPERTAPDARVAPGTSETTPPIDPIVIPEEEDDAPQ